MLPKPDTCKGCPLYGTGKGWVPDEIKSGARVLIYGQNPGEDEEREGRPFVGKTGALMESEFFKRAGLSREEVSIGNAIRCRWRFGNELPPVEQKITQEALAHCTQAHFVLPEGTKLIVAQGAYALKALTGEHTISDWRGYLLPRIGTPEHGGSVHLKSLWTPRLGSDVPVLATLHIASLFRDPSMALATKADWGKVARFLRGVWPKACPPVDVLPPDGWPAKVSFDTEYHRVTKELHHYSLAWVGADGPQVHSVPIGNHITPLTPPLSVITQNAWADWRHLWDVLEVPPGFVVVDDTMLKHAILYPDQPHDLNYLGSLYSSMNRWKHLREVPGQITEYAGADAWGTWEVDVPLEAEFRADPLSRGVYEKYMRPLVPIIEKATTAGIRTEPRRVRIAEAAMLEKLNRASAQAQAASGWAINLGSNPQVGHHLYEVLGFPEKKGRKKKK